MKLVSSWSNLSGADVPAGRVVAREIAEAGGPIAVNSLPPRAPGSGAHHLALDALHSGCSTAFLVCGVAAAVAAALTAFGMIGVRARHSAEEELSALLPPTGDGRPEPAPTA